MNIGILYLIATPIGNLGDLTPRAAQTIEQVDFIAAEDTRVSQKLLQHLGFKKPMVSYYEHNRRQRGAEIIARLQQGESCALMTDAGTPAVSDPGEELVALCAEQGIPVIPLPGACAAVCALAASGLPSTRWCFEGFLPVPKKERQARLEVLAKETRTSILYEAPHKLRTTLADLMQACGADRRISLSRELTKLHEETLHGTLKEITTYYTAHEPRGEYVLVLEGCAADTQDDEEDRMEKALQMVNKLLADGESQKDAVKEAAKTFSVRKNALYQRTLEE